MKRYSLPLKLGSVVLIIFISVIIFTTRQGASLPSLNRIQNASAVPSQPSLLTCLNVKNIVKEFLKHHYAHRDFTAELSSRTFYKMFQLLDPGKNFFLQSDITSLKNYEFSLPQHIDSVDCRFIYDAHEILVKRAAESELLVKEYLLQEPKFDDSEFIEVDRRKLAWSNDQAQLKNRWRQLFKFMRMNFLSENITFSERIQSRYQSMKKKVVNRTHDELFSLFINAFASSLDPHSSYLSPEDQSEFKTAFSLELVGIGASLSQLDGYTVVESVIPGGAAAKDGRLKKGDRIIAVEPGDERGTVDVIDMDIDKVVQLIRGKKDTVVKLTLLRKSASGDFERISLELTRDLVRLTDAEAQSGILTIENKRIGVINLPSFYIDYDKRAEDEEGEFRSSYRDTMREIEKLKKQNIDGLILDLRKNGGGDLSECIKITGLFIEVGNVVQVRSQPGTIDALDDSDPYVGYSGPMIVLTSKQSASASEIIAGALQDYGRALIIGNQQTYGKATVQNILEAPGSSPQSDLGALKVTISKFYRPSGNSNQQLGVLSDIVIPDLTEAFDIREGEHDYVLPHDTIRPHRFFKPLQSFEAIRAELDQRSKERIKSSAEFQKLIAEIETAKKESNQTQLELKLNSVPLNLNQTSQSEESDGIIHPNDIQLREAGAILLDAVQLLGKSTDWVTPNP